MVNSVQDADLVGEPLPGVVICNLIPFEDLNGNRLMRMAFDSQKNLSECTLTEDLEKRVVPYTLRPA